MEEDSGVVEFSTCWETRSAYLCKGILSQVRNVCRTFDRLRIEEIMNHVLNARRLHCFVDALWEVLVNDTAFNIRECLLEFLALMTDATTHIDEHRLGRIPPFGRFFNGVD